MDAAFALQMFEEKAPMLLDMHLKVHYGVWRAWARADLSRRKPDCERHFNGEQGPALPSIQ